MVEKLSDFVARMQESDQMLLDNVLRDAALRPHIPSLLAQWVQIRFSNWLDGQWADRDVVPPPQFNKLWLWLKLEEAWGPTFPQGYSLEPLGPQPLAALRYMR